ncbi:hypothetical protein BHE90_017044 [Fusarium euwallaceae]|uniref:Uncharacterized protein n=1 Tax=Fusarium euwallaceae TaxID=1147111 RepID=A0A430KYN3_9HYPO|nr:hypothetical protein BHE90_017044 [Fusarium euwallaceae]
MAMGALSLVNKIHNIPDLDTVRDALQMARIESKIAAESTTQALNDIKTELKQVANTSQQALDGIRESHEAQIETKAAARESTDIGRTVVTMVRDIKNVDQRNRPDEPSGREHHPSHLTATSRADKEETTWERRGDAEFAQDLSRELLGNAPEDTLVSGSTGGRPYSLLLRKWL